MAILLLNDIQTMCGIISPHFLIDGENRLKARTFSFLERILLLVYRLAFILAKRIN